MKSGSIDPFKYNSWKVLEPGAIHLISKTNQIPILYGYCFRSFLSTAISSVIHDGWVTRDGTDLANTVMIDWWLKLPQNPSL